jgi:thiol-disulfide isomerase/thioredoxin
MRIDPQSVHAPEIGPVWLNSPPLTLRQFRGRIVLLDFWDFTCVNCLRTLPYITAWHRRYQPLGVQVLGIHAPEFYFSRAPEVVERALAELGIDYPVMLDNDYTVWKLFANRYWPTKYLIDGEGYMRYAHFGEGAYTETEEAIQELLREQNPNVTLPPTLPLVRALDEPGALAFCPQPSPEIYLGHRRGRLANPGGFKEDDLHRYDLGAGPQADTPELAGLWNSLPDCLTVGSRDQSDPSRLCLLYSAAEVNLVLCPSLSQPQGRIDITENGAPLPPAARGADIRLDANGQTYLLVDRPRMYRVVNRSTFDTALLELRSTTTGLQLFAFTFGSCLEGRG